MGVTCKCTTLNNITFLELWFGITDSEQFQGRFFEERT